MTTTSGITRMRRAMALAMVVGGVGLLTAPAVVAQDEVRTQTELFGYDLDATAAPVSVRIFEKFIPIPTDPGDPQFEITTSHTSASLGSGPNARAVASSIWPGAALGDGFGTVIGDEEQTYPIRAAATYPGRGEDSWRQETTIEGVEGFGMYAEALGLDVAARAEGGGLPAGAAAVVSHGQVRSESTTTVVDGQAVARGVSEIAEVALLGGIIVLEGVTTELTATSDGNGSATEGRTTVAGIEVMGMPVRLTDQGAVVTPPEEGGDDADDEDPGPLGPVGDLLDPVNEAFQALTDDLVADGIEDVLGIRIEALQHTEAIDGAVAERIAEGVTITVDTGVLRGYLGPLLDVVPIGDILSAIPNDDEGNVQQLKGLVFEVLGLGPTIEYVIGRGTVAASAAPAYEAPAPPPLPDPPPPPPMDSGAGDVGSGTSSPPSSGVSAPPPTRSSTPQVPGPSVAPPQPEAPAVASPTLAADPIDLFGGVPVAAVAVSLLLAAVPTLGLRTLREAAVGPDADVRAPRPLPDLRGGA